MLSEGDRERSPRRPLAGRTVVRTIPLVELLLQQRILDEKCADYLNKAPLALASEVLLGLGPEVRNPSAFVTNKLKPWLGSAGHAGASFGGNDRRAPLEAPGAPWNRQPLESPRGRQEAPHWHGAQSSERGETFTVHCNGRTTSLLWLSQEKAIHDLRANGILDVGSADFLMQAPEHICKDIISNLGPDVRNPSAYVTRKLKELRKAGHLDESKSQMAMEAPRESRESRESEMVMVHHRDMGAPMPLHWISKDQAVRDLVDNGVLDDSSADFLMKVPDHLAKEIVQSLGPDVRNPSGFVTRKCKEAIGGGGGGGSSARQRQDMPHRDSPTVTVYHDGVSHTIEWPSPDVGIQQMLERRILDDRSADFLHKLPERAAWDIVSKIGPDVRNPSAFVTRECKSYEAGGLI